MFSASLPDFRHRDSHTVSGIVCDGESCIFCSGNCRSKVGKIFLRYSIANLRTRRILLRKIRKRCRPVILFGKLLYLVFILYAVFQKINLYLVRLLYGWSSENPFLLNNNIAACGLILALFFIDKYLGYRSTIRDRGLQVLFGNVLVFFIEHIPVRCLDFFDFILFPNDIL